MHEFRLGYRGFGAAISTQTALCDTITLGRRDCARGEEAFQAGYVVALSLDGAFKTSNILHQALGGQARTATNCHCSVIRPGQLLP